MSAVIAEKSSPSNFNYLIQEDFGDDSREIIANIATFFSKQYNHKILIITKKKLSVEEAEKLFCGLTSYQRRLITFIYCKNYQVVLDKLLEIDTSITVPKVVILESLHQWYDDSTVFEKVPSIYSTIFAATQDLINTNSRILKETCYSFITSRSDDWPTHIINLFYDSPIVFKENCLEEIFEKHKNVNVN